MSTGALAQLVAVGVQDEKLTREPEITFFKSTYRPYVNFATESIENTPQGVANFGRRVSWEVQRNGDLVTKMTLEVDMPELNVDFTAQQDDPVVGDGLCWTPMLGHALVDWVRVLIGGVEIDRHYGRWFDLYDNLTRSDSMKRGYYNMIGQQVAQTGVDAGGPVSAGVLVANPNQNFPPLQGVGGVTGIFNAGAVVPNGMQPNVLIYQGLQTPRASPNGNPGSNPHPATRLYIPLRFWFNQNAGLALPLIALQFHQVRIETQLRPARELIRAFGQTTAAQWQAAVNSASINNMSLWVDYVYLDNDARQYMAQNPHEYLITQLQYNDGQSVTSATPRIDLRFNHPVKELIWAYQENEATDADNPVVTDTPNNLWYYYDTLSTAGSVLPGNQPVATSRLQMNGIERFSSRQGAYFARVEPYYHHTSVPNFDVDNQNPNNGTQNYSFALDSQDLQPQGTANFSRLDTVTLLSTLTNMDNSVTGVAHVFAVNYNFFRVAGGMGGQAFAA